MIEENIKPEQTLKMVVELQVHFHFAYSVSPKQPIGFVTARQQIPIGYVWTKQEIEKRKKVTEDTCLRSAVVERIPVHKESNGRPESFNFKLNPSKRFNKFR